MGVDLKDLSESEIAALRWVRESTSILVSHIPDKTYRNEFGDPVPGMAIFKRLEKRGLLFQTEEEPVNLTDDPDEKPFYFTESIEFTDEGRELASKLK